MDPISLLSVICVAISAIASGVKVWVDFALWTKIEGLSEEEIAALANHYRSGE